MTGHEPVFYGAVTVGERGQVVIPQQAREAQGIKPGDKMLVLGGGFDGHGLVMIKADAVSGLLAKLSERVTALERVFRMSAEQAQHQEESRGGHLGSRPGRGSGNDPDGSGK
ncbi:MAG: AbrB/MazE/SpoVT family DNA-binding domain-containing protein [Clostridia bacterium]